MGSPADWLPPPFLKRLLSTPSSTSLQPGEPGVRVMVPLASSPVPLPPPSTSRHLCATVCSAQSSAAACSLAHLPGGNWTIREKHFGNSFKPAEGRKEDTSSLSSGVFRVLQRPVTRIPFLNQTLLGPQVLHQTGIAIASTSASGHSAVQVPPLGLSFLLCKTEG